MADDEKDPLLEALDARIRAIVVEELEKRAPPDDEWLTVGQAMKMTNISEWTIRQLARQGKIMVYQNPGRRPLRINRRSLFEMMSEEAKKGSKK